MEISYIMNNSRIPSCTFTPLLYLCNGTPSYSVVGLSVNNSAKVYVTADNSLCLWNIVGEAMDCMSAYSYCKYSIMHHFCLFDFRKCILLLPHNFEHGQQCMPN